MILLLDTHLLLWAAYAPDRLGDDAVGLIQDPAHTPMFSAASIWEIAIKASLGREDFDADPRTLRRGLLEAGYRELSVTSAHAVGVHDLPMLHRDPFDRLLVAQARSEGVTLLTVDALVVAYGPPVRFVG